MPASTRAPQAAAPVRYRVENLPSLWSEEMILRCFGAYKVAVFRKRDSNFAVLTFAREEDARYHVERTRAYGLGMRKMR